MTNSSFDSGTVEATKNQQLASDSEKFTIAQIATIIGTVLALVMVINQIFNFQIFGIVLIEAQYLNLLGGIFLAIAYLIYRINGTKNYHPKWYDCVFAVISLMAAVYLSMNANNSLSQGWDYAAPDNAKYVSLVFMFMVLEATRRAGGWILFVIVTVFALYPSFAGSVPSPFTGYQTPFLDSVAYHTFSSESIFGIPMKAFGGIVIGFILFGSVLQYTGGGQFFNDLALGLVGRYRGGAAKVSIFASGFMGSMSGSVISNILSTGSISIPAMKKSGFSAKTAAATEACASTGGVLMPPIMGAVAFVMASFLSVPYINVVIAAIIPSVLFYFGLFVQIDSYSARRGLRGMLQAELPRMKQTLKSGWPYIFAFSLLIFMMVVWRMEDRAAFYVTILILLINQAFPSTRMSLRRFGALIANVGSGLAELTAIILGIGLVVGSFSATGLAGTLVNELVFIAGDNTFVLLFMGALTAFIFGMGMTTTACYIFLAVVLAPALEQNGLNQMAVHMFILYWGMVSYLTPPVAIGAYAAASLAGTNAMKAGFEAMRLGGVIYIAPFFFVLNPALVAQAPLPEIAFAVSCALLGILLIGNALQGYVTFVGTLKSKWEFPIRVLLFIGGFLIALPHNKDLPIGGVESLFAGVVLALPAVLLALKNRQKNEIPIEVQS